jgi:hypothetical protein
MQKSHCHAMFCSEVVLGGEPPILDRTQELPSAENQIIERRGHAPRALPSAAVHNRSTLGTPTPARLRKPIPEQAEADAAHCFSAKEERPPYRTHKKSGRTFLSE